MARTTSWIPAALFAVMFFQCFFKTIFLRFEIQIASQLASPGSPQDSNGCQNGAKMHPKMGAIAPPRIKMLIVSKTYYLLCFSYKKVVPETFKNWFLPSQFPLQLLSPPFGHQGILKKRLGCHLQAINTKKCRKWSPKRAPKLGPFLDILPLFAVPGALGSQNGSQGSPKSPQGPSKPRFSAILNRFLIDWLMIFRVTWATFC